MINKLEEEILDKLPDIVKDAKEISCDKYSGIRITYQVTPEEGNNEISYWVGEGYGYMRKEKIEKIIVTAKSLEVTCYSVKVRMKDSTTEDVFFNGSLKYDKKNKKIFDIINDKFTSDASFSMDSFIKNLESVGKKQ